MADMFTVDFTVRPLCPHREHSKTKNAACSHYNQMCGIFKIFTASGTHQKRKPASLSRAEDVQQKLVCICIEEKNHNSQQ